MPNTLEREMQSHVGRVVTFNGLLDYIEQMFSRDPEWVDPTPLKGHIGFVIDYRVHFSDLGDPENGPRLEIDAYWLVYVPAYGKTFQTTPDHWV